MGMLNQSNVGTENLPSSSSHGSNRVSDAWNDNGAAVGSMTSSNASSLNASDTTTAKPSTQHTTSQSNSDSMNMGEKLAAEMVQFSAVVGEVRASLPTGGTFDERCKQVVKSSAEFFGLAPTWTAFYRESISKSGLVHEIFPNADEYDAFLETESYLEILDMLTALRSQDLPENDPTESQKMITIRIPLSLHKTICEEANRLEVSVNKLCISRLVQHLDTRMIPSSKNKRRGRRPGAAVVEEVNS